MIEFKAKDYSFRGNWVYGLPVKLVQDSDKIDGIQTDSFENVDIRPETLSQFTNVYDKHKNKLYQNDLFKDDKGNIYRIYAKKGGFSHSLPQFKSTLNGSAPWPLQPLSDEQTISFIESCCERIGNIFDNPELIKI